MAYIGRNPAIGTQKVLDSLESQFNGTLTTFDLRYNTNTIYPTIASALIVSLGGVLQEPGSAYNVASDQITFATAPPTGADCWILLYSEFGGQAGATANLTVSNNLTIGNELRGPANFVIDPAVIGNNTGTVEIKGDLTVQGTTTTINSTTLTVDDKNIVLASGAADNAAADGAGITIDTANATLLYKATPDAWSFNKNVGIGTDNPLSILHTKTSGGEGLRIQGTASSAFVRFVDGSNNSTGYFGHDTTFSIVNQRNTDMRFLTNDLERLRITSGGDVNIGPSANANGHGLLTLSQSASAAFNALVIQQGNTAFTATDGLQIGIDAGVNAYFKLYENRDFYFTTGTSNTERLRITSGGNVGIGTDNPGSKLHVQGTAYVQSNFNVGTAFFTNGPGVYISKSGSKFLDDSLWMQPEGNVHLAVRGAAGSDNWIGIGGHYVASSGSSNLLLQANFAGVGQGAGFAIRSIATDNTGGAVLQFDRVISAAATSGRPTYSNVFYVDDDAEMSVKFNNPVYFQDNIGVIGGFGARSTGGTIDWNDSTNARSGNGYTLLLGSATNGPGSTAYYHAFSFEYGSKNSAGNMTQLAIPYNGSGIKHRYRYGGTWSAWTSV